MQYSVFALELCCPFEPQSVFRGELYQLITTHPEQAQYGDKWRFYESIAAALTRELPSFEYGCWDFYDDDAIARDKYDEWCGGLVNEEGVRQTPSMSQGQGPFRQSAERLYMTFTMAFLLVRNSSCERALAARCDVHQQNLWRRDVFGSLIQGIRYLNFASVRSDVVYMIPGRDDFGLTEADLRSGKFDYLRQLV